MDYAHGTKFSILLIKERNGSLNWSLIIFDNFRLCWVFSWKVRQFLFILFLFKLTARIPVWYLLAFHLIVLSLSENAQTETLATQAKEKALASAPVKPRWWRRYVDDPYACLKNAIIEYFHKHLNSIKPHIQFMVEMSTVTTEGQVIAFLDTSNTVCGQVGVGVYRKPTHTNKYLQ